MTALILSLAAVSTSIVMAWLTVRDVDALPKMWRRIRFALTVAVLFIAEVFEFAPTTLDKFDESLGRLPLDEWPR